MLPLSKALYESTMASNPGQGIEPVGTGLGSTGSRIRMSDDDETSKPLTMN
jgi:hypothetical protein